MPDILGHAAITWSATSESVSERVLLLSTPLRELQHGRSMESFQRESLDRRTVENVAIGQGAPELSGSVRYGRDPGGLGDMITAGSAGKPLTYYADRRNFDDGIECTLIAPRTPHRLRTDPQRGTLGDQSVELVLRPTSSGKRFERLTHGSNVRWFYRAGGHMENATITRDTTEGTYRRPVVGGTWAQASSGTARIHWYNTVDSQQPTEPALLIEPERTQLVAASLVLTSTDWTAVSGGTASSGQSDPFGGTDAYRIEGAATSAGIEQAVTLSGSSGFLSVSAFVRQPFTESTSIPSVVLLSSGGTELIRADLTFVRGSTPSVVASTSGVVSLPPEASRDGWYRFHYVTTAEQSTGEYTLRFIAADGSTGLIDVFCPQVELGRFPTSPILSTTSGTKTRADDYIRWQFTGRAKEATAYLKFRELGSVVDKPVGNPGGPVFHVGVSTSVSEGTGQHFRISATSSAGYIVQFQNQHNHVVSESITVESALGTDTELVGHLFSDGSVRLTQVNEGVSAQSDRSSGIAIFEQWTTNEIAIGSFRSTGTSLPQTAVGLMVGLFADGIIEIDGCRRVAGERL